MRATQCAGRALLAGVFIHGGLSTLLEPDPRVEAAGPLLAWLRKRLPVLPGDQALVRANAGVHLAAGLLLATGAFQRLTSSLLALSLVPTTIAGHGYPFWESSDPAQRDAELIQLVKNTAVFGALVFLAGSASSPGHGRR